MELKLRKGVDYSGDYVCSNRTFMELKLNKNDGMIVRTLVLIVPLWN